MIILDTNVLSELMKQVADPQVVAWLNAQLPGDVGTTAITVFEIEQGLRTMPLGKRRQDLMAAFVSVLVQDLGGRVQNFDSAAATEAARIVAALQAAGRPIDIRDSLIAGTVAAQGGILATRNIKHFAHTGIQLIDPWQP